MTGRLLEEMAKLVTKFAAFLFTGPYRELAKVLGRKLVIFMNICGFAIDSCFFIAVCKILIATVDIKLSMC